MWHVLFLSAGCKQDASNANAMLDKFALVMVFRVAVPATASPLCSLFSKPAAYFSLPVTSFLSNLKKFHHPVYQISLKETLSSKAIWRRQSVKWAGWQCSYRSLVASEASRTNTGNKKGVSISCLVLSVFGCKLLFRKKQSNCKLMTVRICWKTDLCAEGLRSWGKRWG